MDTITMVNVAPQSTKGHFISTKKVVVLNQTSEEFFVEEDTKLISENHQTLDIEGACEVFPQQVYNPIQGFVRAKD